jgi:two-component system, OmpR family, alkaline phosphatase synthesis response regulator PhoP
MSKKPKILLVDDVRGIIEQEREILAGLDVDIITAETGTEALKIITQEKPDIVLLDLMLPGMNGDTVCKFVKARPELHTSVVMVTGREDEKELQRCFASGCDAYVTKPIDSSDLLNKVQMLLDELELAE